MRFIKVKQLKWLLDLKAFMEKSLELGIFGISFWTGKGRQMHEVDTENSVNKIIKVLLVLGYLGNSLA